MKNEDIKNHIIFDTASIILAFIGLFCSVVASLNHIYIMIGLFGLLFLSRYIYYIYHDNMRIKQVLFVIVLAIYILVCLVDQTYYMLFIIYFVATSIENVGIYGYIKRLLVMLLPESLLILKFQLFSGRYKLLEIILVEVVLLFAGIIFLIVDKVLTKYAYTNDKMNEALSRAAINELESKRMNKELALKNVFADRNARLEEREKISMDIHNSVGHTITAAIMALDAAEVIYDVERMEAKNKLMVANARMHESLTSIRKAVRVLNDKDVIISIEELFQSLIECMRHFELDTNVKLKNNLNSVNQSLYRQYIDAKHGNFLYGALQESLSNGVRHGKATAFIVLVEIEDKNIRLSVQDNGIGLGPMSVSEKDRMLKNGFGLKKIKNYIDNVGGEFHYNGYEGFMVTITLPLLEVK